MEVKELFRVRRKFVEGVNEELIKQLLDDILADGVVNDEEKDSILEENPSKADKARCLIDMVRRKGDEASRKMIDHIKDRDPALYKNLGLSSGQPTQPAAEPQTEKGRSPTLRPTTKAFWREKQNNKSRYLVTEESIRNRVALLISNITFTDKKLNRDGAEKDEQNMEKLLEALEYEVVKHTNLTGKKIDEAVIKFSEHPKLKETDSVFVIIMSHGKPGAVLGVNYEEGQSDEKQDKFRIDNIYKHLGSKKCPALLNKPKIIIIQACRGGERGSVLVSDSAEAAVVCDDAQQPDLSMTAGEDDIEEDAFQRVHKEKDFMCFLSSTPDTVSYREDDKGSFLIQYTVEVFSNSWRENDIEELFRKVMQRFEDFSVPTKRGQDTQMPTKERCTLTRRFYFRPLSQA